MVQETVTYQIICGDMLDALATMADSSAQLIIADIPYYKVKALDWDRQWRTVAEYLAWVDRCAEQWQRVLAPNGSLYVFAAPQSREGCTMAARVECQIAERFNVVNSLVWHKPVSRAQSACKEALRGFFPASERIIFAEHYGADGYAKGEAGSHFFQPVQRQIAEAARGESVNSLASRSELPKTQLSHYFRRDANGWRIPSQAAIDAMGLALSENLLRREYEDLRADYKDLRRPFSVSADVPYTDVWTFATVQSYPGKHPCEKPLDLLRHIVRASSRPDDTVLDPCCGSGRSGVAAVMEGRNYIGCDISEHWAGVARQNIAEYQAQPLLIGAKL